MACRLDSGPGSALLAGHSPCDMYFGCFSVSKKEDAMHARSCLALHAHLRQQLSTVRSHIAARQHPQRTAVPVPRPRGVGLREPGVLCLQAARVEVVGGTPGIRFHLFIPFRLSRWKITF